jgi:transcriptional regulator with XRE-family HTH domain
VPSRRSLQVEKHQLLNSHSEGICDVSEPGHARNYSSVLPLRNGWLGYAERCCKVALGKSAGDAEGSDLVSKVSHASKVIRGSLQKSKPRLSRPQDSFSLRDVIDVIVPRKTPGPSGAAYPITRPWQEAIRARLDDLGWSQHDLAKAVGCTQPAIAWVLRPQAKQSSLVPKIHKALGLTKVAAPSTAEVSPVRAELADLLESLTDEELAHIVATARLVARSKKSE